MSPEMRHLLAAGDPAFLHQLDGVNDPATLTALARRWSRDRRRDPRALLLAYLDRPLNVFHEPLVVRLLRRAIRSGDDEVMAGMMLLFDRSLRRQVTTREVAGSPPR